MRLRASGSRWLAALVVLALVSFAAVVTTSAPAVAVDEEQIVFEGSGWGHGVGMSQFGAQAMASDPAESRTYEEILGYYYADSTIGRLGMGGVPSIGDIHVSASSDQTTRRITIADGPGTSGIGVVVSRGAEATLEEKELSGGDSFTVTDTAPQSDGGCAVAFSDGTVWATETPGGARLSCDITIPLAPDTAPPPYIISLDSCRTDNCTFAWGTAVLLVDNGSDLRTVPDKVCPGDCPLYDGFDVVVQLPVDTYTRGIAEVPFSWHPEALKTQAVAARSYAARSAIRPGHDHATAGCFCDVANSSASQVYGGWLGTRDLWQVWDAAAVATTGHVVAHSEAPEGTIVEAVYSSSSGGATESSADKWGNPHSYLSSVSDPWSLTTSNPYRSWTATTLRATLSDWLGMADVETVAVIERNDSGSPRIFRFNGVGVDGASVTKDRFVGSIQARFSLRSWYFDIVIPEGAPPPATTTTTIPPMEFSDITDTIHRTDIEYLAERGIALACDEGANRFCPDDPMRREDIAAFLARALDLPATSADFFTDDDGREFEADINRIAAVGVTRGCNPPANDLFCPDQTVTRGQMAAFLVRAWHLTDPGTSDWFVDDDRSVFEGDIDRLATVGMTKGCNPPTNDRYCPERHVTRAETASFLARALRNL